MMAEIEEALLKTMRLDEGPSIYHHKYPKGSPLPLRGGQQEWGAESVHRMPIWHVRVKQQIDIEQGVWIVNISFDQNLSKIQNWLC